MLEQLMFRFQHDNRDDEDEDRPRFSGRGFATGGRKNFRGFSRPSRRCELIFLYVGVFKFSWVTFFGTRFCFCSTLNLYWILIFLPNLILLSLFCLEPMTSRLLGVCPAAELQQPRPVGFLKCSSLVSTNGSL